MDTQSKLIKCSCGNDEFKAEYRKEMSDQFLRRVDTLHMIFLCTKCGEITHFKQKII